MVLLALFVFMIHSPVVAGLVLVTRKDNELDKLSKSQAKKIYLGTVKKLPNGQKVQVADHKNEEVRRVFYDKVVGKSGSDLKSYWAKLVFTGRGYPPKELASDKEIIQWLLENKDGIAYVDEKSFDPQQLKVLLTVP